MKLFLDSEFTGLHQKTTLISIALASEDGRTFYAESTEFDKNQNSVWIEENVLPNLMLQDKSSGYTNQNPIDVMFKGNTKGITIALSQWLKQFQEVEIWSDVLAYDWVLFCDLFGDALSLPKNVYPYPFDICTLFKVADVDPDISREGFIGISSSSKHNCLYDAVVIKACYCKLWKEIKQRR